MTPDDLKANVARFNDAGARAQDALRRFGAFQATNPLPDGLEAILTDYMAAVEAMLETSSELIQPALELASK